MKKAYLQFMHNGDMIVPGANNTFRRLRIRRFTNVAYLEDGNGNDDDDDEPEKKEQKALLKKIQSQVRKELQGRASKSDVDNIVSQLSFLTKSKNEKGESIDSPFPIDALRTMADEKSGVMAKLTEMGLEIQKLKAAGERSIKDMSIRGQVKSWLESKPKEFGGTRTVSEIIDSIRNGVRENLPPLEIRVASPMLVSTVNSGSSPYIGSVEKEAGVTPILRFPRTFWDFLTKGRTGAATYVWVNKSNPLGAAAFIGPGVAKPGISFELVADNSIAKKIAVSTKAGMELLQDIDGMTSFIEDELRVQLEVEINSKLMTGVSSSTVPAGIQTLSQPYSFYTVAAANIKTTNPTYMDAIRSVVAALRSGKIVGDITVFINAVDSANMDIAKANDSGVYLLPPFVTADGRIIAGARVVEDPNIIAGNIQAAFTQYYVVKIYKDMTITYGWENDDFTKNLTTVIAEMRLHQIFNQQYTGAFLYDTFANVINAITAA